MTDRPDLAEIVKRHQEAKRRLANREEAAMNTTPTTGRKFEIGDFVRVHPTPDDGIDIGAVVAINTKRDVYVVNVGNVYSDTYVRDFDESALTLVDRGGRIADGEDGIDSLHKTPGAYGWGNRPRVTAVPELPF